VDDACNLQRSSQKSEYEAYFFCGRYVQFEQDRPRNNQHGHVRDQTWDAVAFVEEHHISTSPVANINCLSPEVSERPADRESEDESYDTLEYYDYSDTNDNATV
jgi:hypothetical protein